MALERLLYKLVFDYPALLWRAGASQSHHELIILLGIVDKYCLLRNIVLMHVPASSLSIETPDVKRGLILLSHRSKLARYFRQNKGMLRLLQVHHPVEPK